MLISLIITLIVLGLIVYCINLLPLPEPFKTIIYVIFIIVVIGYLLGFLPGTNSYFIR